MTRAIYVVLLAILTATRAAACDLCLYGPDNIAFDAAGNLYLVDTDHKTRSRVLELSPSGGILAQWHVFAAGTADRNGPEGIAIDRDGNVLVTDAGSGRVLKLGKDGTVAGSIGSGFSDLGHVAVDSAGRIYVAQAGPNSIQVFSPNGELTATWHRERGAAAGQWGGPESIAAQSDGTLVVEDWRNRRIEILSPSGQTALTFGRKGSGPGEFTNTAGLYVDRDSNIYVADIALHRVQKFDARGNLLATIGNTPGHTLFETGPGAIAVDARGNLYAPDGSSIVKFSPDGTELSRWQ